MNALRWIRIPWVVLVASSALLAAIFIADYITGPSFTFSLFYLAPILLVTWFARKEIGLLFCVLSAAAMLVVDITGGTSSRITAWNLGIRMGYLLVVWWLVARVRLHYGGLAQTVRERNAALAVASEIQSRFTPRSLAEIPGVEIAFSYQPAVWVGGDYCDVWMLRNGRMALAVGDVAGKGLPAALVMVSLQAALRNTMAIYDSPADVLARVDEFLTGHLPEYMFVTLFLAVYNPADGRLLCANAGHPLPFIVSPGKSVAPLDMPVSVPLGLSGIDLGSVKISDTKLERSDTLVIVSDGIADTRSPHGEMFGLDRLQRVLATTGGSSARETVQAVIGAVSKFRSTASQEDDVTLLALHATRKD